MAKWSPEDPRSRVTSYRLIYYYLTGSVEYALILSQIEFWSDTIGDKNGWFYKSRAQIKMETGVPKRQLENARILFKSLAFVEEHSRGPRKPTLYRFDHSVVSMAIKDFAITNPEIYGALFEKKPMPKTFKKRSPAVARLYAKRRKKSAQI